MERTAHRRAQSKSDIAICNSDFAASLLESTICCAVVDSIGKVIRASDTLCEIAPGILDKNIKVAFDIDNIALIRTSGSNGVYGIYRNTEGEWMPALLHALYDVSGTGGSTLVEVMDGSAFRAAETNRFESTPYPVIRVSRDGTIRFANAEACWTLARKIDDTVGRPLASIFGRPDAATLLDALERCMSGRTPETVEVVPGSLESSVEDHMRLLLTPDMTPDLRVLGAVAVIQSSVVERVRDDISKISLDADITDWRERLTAILNRIHRVIKFDHANFGIYAEDVKLFQALVTFPRDEPKWRWPERWMELPAMIKDWLEKEETFIPDVPYFVSLAPPPLRRNEVVKHYEKLQVLSSVTLVARDTKGPMSALTLCSLELNKYSARDLTFLRGLDLESVLVRIEADMQTERQNFKASIRDDFAKADCPHAAAADIVQRIADHFHWDYVGLFRVDRYNNKFELVHQNACRRRYRLEKNYVQPIDIGMLAATLAHECALTNNKIGAPDVEQYGFVNLGRPSRSAMTIPMKLNDRIRWIFDIESETANAFRGPDTLAIQELVRKMQDGLKQRMQAEIKVYLLKEAQQGVLVVGIDGAILEMNEVASGLLGRTTPKIAKGELPFMSDYVDKADPDLNELVNGRRDIEKHRLVLRGEDGRVRSALGTRAVLEESFDTALWSLKDIETDLWGVELSFLRETVSDVAQQTRAPLAMASTMARRLCERWEHPLPRANEDASSPESVAMLCKSLVAELSKVDITFERLAEGLSIRKEPMRLPKRLDLGHRIQDVINSLPERDRQRLRFRDADTRCFITGDAGRLGFVFRSLIAYLIRVRTEPYSSIEVSLTSRETLVVVAISLMPSRPDQAFGPELPAPADAIWKAYTFARDDASLASSAVNAVVKSHKGVLNGDPAPSDSRDPSPRWTGFEIKLPLAERYAS